MQIFILIIILKNDFYKQNKSQVRKKKLKTHRDTQIYMNCYLVFYVLFWRHLLFSLILKSILI